MDTRAIVLASVYHADRVNTETVADRLVGVFYNLGDGTLWLLYTLKHFHLCFLASDFTENASSSWSLTPAIRFQRN